MKQASILPEADNLVSRKQSGCAARLIIGMLRIHRGFFSMAQSDRKSDSDHEMPPMGGNVMSWGFAGFFIIPFILVLMVFDIPMCAPSPEFDGTAPLYAPETERETTP